MIWASHKKAAQQAARGGDILNKDHPYSFEDYKAALQDTPSERIREELLAEADRGGRFSPWQMAELSMVREELWA